MSIAFYTIIIWLEISYLATFFWKTSWWLASQLVDLVWLNKASIPNFSLQGGLEVLQIYLPGWVGDGVGSHTDYKTNLSSQLDLHWTGQLELSLAKSVYNYYTVNYLLKLKGNNHTREIICNTVLATMGINYYMWRKIVAAGIHSMIFQFQCLPC